MGNEPKYEEVDVVGLSEYWAEESWNYETASVPDEELWIDKEKKQITHRWAVLFWQLVDKYRLVIMEYIKPKQNIPYPATIENTREKCLNCGMEIWYAHEVEKGLCTFCSNKIDNIRE